MPVLTPGGQRKCLPMLTIRRTHVAAYREPRAIPETTSSARTP